MEGVYGRCWTAVAKESAYSPHVTAMPPVGTLFNTGWLKPFPLLAEPPGVNLLKGFLFPTDGPGPVSGLTLRPVSGPTFNCFFNWSWVGDRVWKGVFHNITGGKKRPVTINPITIKNPTKSSVEGFLESVFSSGRSICCISVRVGASSEEDTGVTTSSDGRSSSIL